MEFGSGGCFLISWRRLWSPIPLLHALVLHTRRSLLSLHLLPRFIELRVQVGQGSASNGVYFGLVWVEFERGVVASPSFVDYMANIFIVTGGRTTSNSGPWIAISHCVPLYIPLKMDLQIGWSIVKARWLSLINFTFVGICNELIVSNSVRLTFNRIPGKECPFICSFVHHHYHS